MEEALDFEYRECRWRPRTWKCLAAAHAIGYHSGSYTVGWLVAASVALVATIALAVAFTERATRPPLTPVR